MTQKVRLFNKTLLAAAVAVVSGQTMAAGFQLNAQSATGIGRAFAGDAIIADNAAVMARNPAAMALFDDVAFSGGFESITTDIEVKNAQYSQAMVSLTNGSILGGSTTSANTDDVGGTSIAPNLHLIVPVNDAFAFGVNAYSNFGTRTEFNDNYVAEEFGGVTDVKSFNFGVAGSYRVNEQLSFGAGLDLIYGQGTMQRSVPGSKGSKHLLNVEEADGWALGFNLGTAFELDENNRFGFAYRYSPEFKAEDDAGQEITLPLPDIAEFSGYHKIEDTSFAVHYSVQWIGWSKFDQIDFDNLNKEKSELANFSSTYQKQYQWQDGWHYSIGGTYYLNKSLTLRAGYMYDTSAQDELTSISVPDSDRQWFSTGLTYHIDNTMNVDFGFTYLLGEETDVKESLVMPGQNNTAIVTQVTGKTQANAILMGLQFSKTF